MSDADYSCSECGADVRPWRAELEERGYNSEGIRLCKPCHGKQLAPIFAGLPPSPAKQRANYLPAPHFYRLNHACVVVNRAFDDTCYLVGSCLDRSDYRDVDVRLILDDEAFDRLFRTPTAGAHNALWSLLCVTISAWLAQQAGLAIDFQIQRQTHANGEFPEGKRWALGIFLDYPGQRPSDVLPQGNRG